MQFLLHLAISVTSSIRSMNVKSAPVWVILLSLEVAQNRQSSNRVQPSLCCWNRRISCNDGLLTDQTSVDEIISLGTIHVRRFRQHLCDTPLGLYKSVAFNFNPLLPSSSSIECCSCINCTTTCPHPLLWEIKPARSASK